VRLLKVVAIWRNSTESSLPGSTSQNEKLNTILDSALTSRGSVFSVASPCHGRGKDRAEPAYVIDAHANVVVTGQDAVIRPVSCSRMNP
jgi:hypothetical protein